MCEKLLNRSTSCEDIKAALALPILVEQEEQTGGLDEYVDSKRQRHEEMMTSMQEEIDKVNESIDKDAEDYIKVAKEEVELIKNQTENTDMEQITTIEQWMSKYDANKKRKIELEKIKDDLSTDLKCLEKARAESTSNIMSKFKDKLTTLLFTSVDEIERLIRDVAADANLRMIKNFRRYEDVNLFLEIEGQSIFETRQNELKTRSKQLAQERAKHLWRQIREKEHKKKITETVYNLTQESFIARDDLMKVTYGLVRGLSELAKGLELPVEYDIQGEYWDNWAASLNFKLDTLQGMCRNIGTLITSAVTSLSEGFVDRIDKVSRKVSWNIKQLEDSQEDKNYVSTEISKLQTTQSQELEDLHVTWQSTINSLTLKIERARTFVHDLKSVWTSHLDRVNELHREIEHILDTSYNAALKKYNDKTAKLKGQIKLAREAKDIDKLNTLCSSIEEKFIDLERDWEESYEEQLEKIETIKRKNVERLIGKHLSHILDFLNVKYPKRMWFSEGSLYESSIGSVSISESENEVDTQINLCSIYMQAVENRGLGMYEMLERFVPYCETTIREETDAWVQMFFQEIVNKYDAKLTEIDDSQKSTLKNLKQIRFAEIQIHSERLASHVAGVKKELGEMTERFDEVKSNQMSALAEFSKKVVSLTEIDRGPGGLRQGMYELVQEWDTFTNDLQKQISENKERCVEKAKYLKGAGDLFIKVAKSFKNGGNYSPEELKTLHKELKQLEKIITNHFKTLVKNYDELSKNIARSVLDSKLEKVQELLKDKTLQKLIDDNLSIVRMRLRAEINNMKRKGKALEQKSNLFSSLNQVDDNLLKDIISMINEMHDFMVFPRGVDSLECTESKQNSTEALNVTTTARSQKSNKPASNSTTSSIFKHFINQDVSCIMNNFLATTKELITRKYAFLINVIETTASGFKPADTNKTKLTSQKQKQVKVDLNTDVQKEQIKQIKVALRSYNSECELAWLSQSGELLALIPNLRNVFNNLAEKELNNIHTHYLTSLETLEKEYLRTIQEKNSEAERAREKLQRSFVLPLAHPNHHRKLTEFQERAKSLSETQTRDATSSVLKYKSELQGMHDGYIEQVTSLKERLNETQTLLFDKDLCRSLFESSKGIRNVFPYEPEEVTPTDGGCKEYSLSVWSDDPEPPQNCHKPSSILLVLLSSSSQTSLESSSLDAPEGVMLSVNRVAAEHAAESALTVQRLYDQAVDAQRKQHGRVEEWSRELDTKIKQAQQFYYSVCK